MISLPRLISLNEGLTMAEFKIMDKYCLFPDFVNSRLPLCMVAVLPEVPASLTVFTADS